MGGVALGPEALTLMGKARCCCSDQMVTNEAVGPEPVFTLACPVRFVVTSVDLTLLQAKPESQAVWAFWRGG